MCKKYEFCYKCRDNFAKIMNSSNRVHLAIVEGNAACYSSDVVTGESRSGGLIKT